MKSIYCKKSSLGAPACIYIKLSALKEHNSWSASLLMHLWIAAWSPCWWGSCGDWPSGCSSCSSRQAGGCRWADPDVQVSGWRGQWCLVCLWRRWWRRSSCWTYHPSRSGSGWWHGRLLHHHLPRCRHEPWLWSPAHQRRERMGQLDEPGDITQIRRMVLNTVQKLII